MASIVNYLQARCTYPISHGSYRKGDGTWKYQMNTLK